jgi:hypothetical protein
MSRITGSDALKMFEAYAAVYAPQELTEEQVWEEVETWVNSLLEEGYDLSDYTWEEMYEAYLEEKEGIFNNDITRGISRAASGVGDYAKSLFNAQNRNPKPTSSRVGNIPPQEGTGRGAPGSRTALDPGRFDREKARLKNVGNPVANQNQNQNAGSGGTATPSATSPTRGIGKLAPAPTKPAAAAQTGDKAKDMATFANAKPGLAAAAAERARTRGTSATTNPLMKDMKSRLPAPAAPKVAPSNTLSNTVAAASKPAAFSPAPEVKATNTIAAAPKLPSVAPNAPMAGRDQMLQRNLKNGMEYDAFDLVLEYLLSQGHTDTLEEALYVMMEMDPETIQSICEGYQELNYKRRNRMTDQAMRHMGKGDDKSWEKAYSIENQRDTQTPEVSKAKAAENRAKGAAKRGKG